MSWHPNRWTAVQLEERRLLAGRLLQAGQLSQAEIARHLEVSPAAVSRWHAALEHGGLAALRRRPHSGRPPRLGDRQWPRVQRLLARGASAAGFDTERWTLRRIARVLERELGVRYHFRAVGRVLRRHGWTPQRPPTQAAERDDALIAAWLRRDWAGVKRGLAAQGASLPSWTRRVTRFGPASAPRGPRAATRPRCDA